MLRSHPRVDPQRIILMGVSRGGQAALYASVKRFHQMWNKSGIEFAGYIAFYPDCAMTWAQKGLQRGDLNALLELKRGWNVSRQACLERLSDREFIEEDDHGKLRVTVKGRVAPFLGRR